MARPPEVTVGRSAVADCGYGVLAGVDLGRDAANLYDPSAPARTALRSVFEPLRAALLADPAGGLVLQGWPLRATSLAALADPPVAPALASAFARAVAAVEPSLPRGSSPASPAPAFDRLTTLLGALWAPLGTSAPMTCRVLDCPALGRHGRAVRLGDVFVVATALGVGGGLHPLMQVFHEAAHPVTDAAVLARLGPDALAARRTAPGTSGFAVHRAIESTAVAYGTAILEGPAADLLTDWEAWCHGSVYSG